MKPVLSLPPAAGQLRVLLADDTEMMREYYSRLLESAGYEVIVSCDGSSVVAAAESQEAALIVLDYMMPGMTGIQAAERLRATSRHAHTPIVLLTAAGEQDGIVAQAFAAGVNDYICKPVNRQVFLGRVKALIGQQGWRRHAKNLEVSVGHSADLAADLVKARELQMSMVPRGALSVGGYEVVGVVEPCGQVGGDLFDVMELRGHTLVAVVDVAGHGVAAAMVASALRTLLRVLALRGDPVASMLPTVNEHLASSDEGQYACVALVELDEAGATIFNAGLPPIAAVDERGICRLVSGAGPPPGLVPGVEYEGVRLSNDDFHALYIASDGVTEPFGSAESTQKYISEIRMRDSNRAPSQQSLREDVTNLFTRASIVQSDDATVVLVTRTSNHVQ